MDGYIIRKGERVDWFTHEDGSLVDCKAGVDIWVEWGEAGRHIRPLKPLGRDEALVVMHPDEARAKAVSGHGTHIDRKPMLTFDPFTYTTEPLTGPPPHASITP